MKLSQAESELEKLGYALRGAGIVGKLTSWYDFMHQSVIISFHTYDCSFAYQQKYDDWTQNICLEFGRDLYEVWMRPEREAVELYQEPHVVRL